MSNLCLAYSIAPGIVLICIICGCFCCERYAAVFAAYVAGTAAMVGMDFGAKFLASLATAFEGQYEKADSLALRNLTLLFSHLFSFSLISR
jgi:nucleolar MIF4G domain-containing protein 1